VNSYEVMKRMWIASSSVKRWTHQFKQQYIALVDRQGDDLVQKRIKPFLVFLSGDIGGSFEYSHKARAVFAEWGHSELLSLRLYDERKGESSPLYLYGFLKQAKLDVSREYPGS
jgi:hypothetical protein